MTLQSVLSAWPIWAPILTVVIASLVTRLTPYPKAGGVVTALRVVLDVLSVLTHKDSPGTFQLPVVQRSQPPEGKLELPPPSVPPVVALLALLALPRLAHADLPAAEVRALPPAAAEPVVSEPPPAPPTIGEILSCTAAETVGALPNALGKCTKNPKASPGIDTRTFWTVFGASMGNVVTTVAGTLLSIYLNPEPVK